MGRDQKFKNMLFFLESDKQKKLVVASSHKHLNLTNFYWTKPLEMEAPWCTLGNRHTPWEFYLIFSTYRTMVGTVIKYHLAHILTSALLGLSKNLRIINHPIHNLEPAPWKGPPSMRAYMNPSFCSVPY